MKYSLVTFGCRVNQSDSLALEEQLLASGARPAPADSADLVVVNSCSVTASADQGTRQTIRRIARLNPNARIVVTGCYATREASQVGQLPQVAHVICNDDKPHLLQLIRGSNPPVRGSEGDHLTSADESTTAQRFGDGEGSCGAIVEPGLTGRTAFTLCVQTGCDEPCSYCIIPATRGTSRSVPPDRVLHDIERVVAAGFREVVLTGVHLGSYGLDLACPSTLGRLLATIRDEFDAPDSDGHPLVLFRISSLEPMDCTPAIVSLVGEAGCFAAHFHLPLQHASGRMLRAMRRPYDLDYYAGLVDSIRRSMPHASIGTDVIVGFPGESDEDFDLLERYLERAPLTYVHVFPYSDRPGTAASRMRERAPGEVVKERGARLRQVGARLTRQFVESQVGAVHRALTLEDGTLAVTGNYLKVRIPSGLSCNEWVRVRVTSTSPILRGDVIEAPPVELAPGGLQPSGPQG